MRPNVELLVNQNKTALFGNIFHEATRCLAQNFRKRYTIAMHSTKAGIKAEHAPQLPGFRASGLPGFRASGLPGFRVIFYTTAVSLSTKQNP
jgi:hypothetical protein